MNQNQIKRLKKSIVKESAINIGFNTSVINKLPEYAIIEAIRKIALILPNNSYTPDADIRNMLVTESVKAMNFQDFKEIKDYFFHNKD